MDTNSGTAQTGASVVRIGLQSFGLNPNEVLKHGIRREVYAIPIGTNARAFLAGRDQSRFSTISPLTRSLPWHGIDGSYQEVSVDYPTDSYVENIFPKS